MYSIIFFVFLDSRFINLIQVNKLSCMDHHPRHSKCFPPTCRGLSLFPQHDLLSLPFFFFLSLWRALSKPFLISYPLLHLRPPISVFHHGRTKQPRRSKKKKKNKNSPCSFYSSLIFSPSSLFSIW